MKVKEFMITNVITSSPETSIKDVMAIFVDKKISGVPIVDADGKLAGIVTDGDILRAIKPIDPRIENYYTFSMYFEGQDLNNRLQDMADVAILSIARKKDIVTVTPDDEMKTVVQLLAKHHFKKLPVVDEKYHVIGVISRGDVIRNIQSSILKELQ
ncbi:MAG TPA: CBS domain-containing protein [Neobacillus sp.]